MTAPKATRDARREAAADRYAERTMPREVDAPTADELDGYCADDAAIVDRIRRGVAGAADWGAL